MDQAAPLDVFVTVTGCRDGVIVGRRHFAAMKDNVLLANAGHDCEWRWPPCREMAARSKCAGRTLWAPRCPTGMHRSCWREAAW